MSKKKIFINVSMAIAKYNAGQSDMKKIINNKTLALKLFAGKKSMSDARKEQLLSSWNNGNDLTAVRAEHLVEICRITGITLNELVTY